MNKEQYLKIEDPQEKADMAVALFREFKRKQDWEFCWQLFRDWITCFDGTGENFDRSILWLDDNWVGNQMGGIFKKNFVEAGGGSFVFLYFSFIEGNDHEGWSHYMLNYRHAVSFGFVLAGIMYLSPQGLLSPGPNFPDLVTVPEEYRLEDGKDH